MRRILTPIEWPGREVRDNSVKSVDNTAVLDEQAEEIDASSLFEEDSHGVVLKALNDAEVAQSELEDEARRALDRHVDIPTTNLPVTRRSLRLIAGSSIPDLPEEDLIEVNNDSISGEVYRRAYSIVENSDRVLLGFDKAQLVDPEFDGTVTPDGPIKSPAQAALERDIPKSAEKVTIEESVEKQISTSEWDLWHKLSEVVMPFILQLLGKLVEGIGKLAQKLGSFKIFGKTVGLGAVAAKPFLLFADYLFRKAEEYRNKAMGLTQEESEINSEFGDEDIEAPSFEEDGESFYTTLDEDGEEVRVRSERDLTYDPSIDNIENPKVGTKTIPGNGGTFFLAAAQRILATTESVASRTENTDLRQALMLHEQARRSRRMLDMYQNTADSWGLNRDAIPTPTDDTGEPLHNHRNTNSDSFAIDCD